MCLVWESRRIGYASFGFRDQSMRFRTLLTLGSGFVLCCLLCAPASVLAQKRVSSERESRPELGDKPDAPLKVETIKGTLKKIDLEKRTVTIAHGESESVFGFPTAAGREKITLSKKVAKHSEKILAARRSSEREPSQGGLLSRARHHHGVDDRRTRPVKSRNLRTNPRSVLSEDSASPPAHHSAKREIPRVSVAAHTSFLSA